MPAKSSSGDEGKKKLLKKKATEKFVNKKQAPRETWDSDFDDSRSNRGSPLPERRKTRQTTGHRMSLSPIAMVKEEKTKRAPRKVAETKQGPSTMTTLAWRTRGTSSGQSSKTRAKGALQGGEDRGVQSSKSNATRLPFVPLTAAKRLQREKENAQVKSNSQDESHTDVFLPPTSAGKRAWHQESRIEEGSGSKRLKNSEKLYNVVPCLPCIQSWISGAKDAKDGIDGQMVRDAQLCERSDLAVCVDCPDPRRSNLTSRTTTWSPSETFVRFCIPWRNKPMRAAVLQFLLQTHRQAEVDAKRLRDCTVSNQALLSRVTKLERQYQDWAEVKERLESQLSKLEAQVSEMNRTLEECCELASQPGDQEPFAAPDSPMDADHLDEDDKVIRGARGASAYEISSDTGSDGPGEETTRVAADERHGGESYHVDSDGHDA
ncbi:hypothetical protein F66182_3233 [Fusarium sp. NRRL 66182]|nr:hypothetical protein F66182_3233 [Fusarium sp. NRRL 66182]